VSIIDEDTRPMSQSRRAMERLRDLILDGELAAGTDHLETELALRLGMSRTPVREAALMLEAQSLLEVRPRKGVRILSVSVEDMHEIYEVLTELESLAARRAAQANYSVEQLTALATGIAKMNASLARKDREGWAVADEAFHDELVRLGGNVRIRAIVANFNDQVRRARAMTLYMRPLPEQSNADHQALYDAIARGDADRAHDIHWQHRTQARLLLTGLLERHGLKRV